MNLIEKSKATRLKLLEVAGDVFARKGFQAAGVREICQKAGVNQAAVNYHFGSKTELYKAVLTHAFESAKPPRPMPRLADDPEHPTEQLRRWIVWNAERMLGSGGHIVYELIVKELREPTPAFDELFEQSMRPIFTAGEELVAAVLEVSQDSEIVQLCCMSVLGQCLVYRHARPIIERFYRSLRDQTPAANRKKPDQARLDRLQRYLQADPIAIARITEHIAAFSLAGITDLARRQKRQPAQ